MHDSEKNSKDMFTTNYKATLVLVVKFEIIERGQLSISQ